MEPQYNSVPWDFVNVYVMMWDVIQCSGVLHRSQVVHTAQFQYHEATRSISTPPVRDASPLQVTPPAFCQVILTVHWYPFILLGGQRDCESRVPCSRTQNNDPSKGSNPMLHMHNMNAMLGLQNLMVLSEQSYIMASGTCHT